MHFLQEGVIAAIIVLLGIGFLQLMLWVRLAELKGDIDLLERRLKEKVEKWEFEWADKKLRKHDEKLEALEVHLGIRFVETPKRLVVKNILEK
jgi:hypothetical protein